ncbi:MAG: helix-turn-helix domain-containing protein [Alphaproteobacteria bacterium]
MENNDAIAALAALAHGHRMAAFRLLVQAGPSGLPAGVLSERLGVPPSSLSFHLAQLVQAGLLRSWRVARRVFYAVDYPATRGLLDFLMQDCCMGLPELCCPPPSEARGETETKPGTEGAVS